MSYGDVWDFQPVGVIRYARYSDGTVLPSMDVRVYRNGVVWGYFDVHMHRVLHPPHASIGFTSRLGAPDEP